MKEFMFYICNEKDAKSSMSAEEHLRFIKACETYIGKLKAEGRMIAAQPIVREGVVVRKSGSEWKTRDIAGDAETQVGYYHILASDLEEAIGIARENPEFEFVPSASIEVRPVKTKESETGFIYPAS